MIKPVLDALVVIIIVYNTVVDSIHNIEEALINSSLNYQSKKKAKCDFTFFLIFNHLSVNENGGPSLCRGNAEFIRVSLNEYPCREGSLGACLAAKVTCRQDDGMLVDGLFSGKQAGRE